MKRNYIHIIYSLLCTLLLSACIKNDIPYPRIKAQILGISADGQIGTAAIDNDKRMVTMELSDTVDLRRVHIETLDLTEGAVSDLPSDSIIDLSKSYTLTLSIYQDYTWTINATQNIERSFRVEGQIGAPVFDAHNHRAIAYVNKDIDLANIKITELVLGPQGITSYSPGDTKKSLSYTAVLWKNGPYISYHLNPKYLPTGSMLGRMLLGCTVAEKKMPKMDSK